MRMTILNNVMGLPLKSGLPHFETPSDCVAFTLGALYKTMPRNYMEVCFMLFSLYGSNYEHQLGDTTKRKFKRAIQTWSWDRREPPEELASLFCTMSWIYGDGRVTPKIFYEGWDKFQKAKMKGELGE